MFNASKLSYLRKKEKMSQEQLANKLNISPSTVGMYDTAKRQPDNEMITKIANLFNVSTDYLLDNDLKDINISEDNKELVQSLVDGLTNPLNKALHSLIYLDYILNALVTTDDFSNNQKWLFFLCLRGTNS